MSDLGDLNMAKRFFTGVAVAVGFCFVGLLVYILIWLMLL